MKQGGDSKNKMARLESVLDAFGADAARWPTAERDALEDLVRTNKAARQLVGEARALERVMDTASAGNASDALRSHIVIAAMEDTSRETTIIPLALKQRQSRNARTTSVQRSIPMWPAAALAASFAFGLYLGAAGIGGAAVEEVLLAATTDISDIYAGGVSWIEDSTAGDGGGLL